MLISLPECYINNPKCATFVNGELIPTEQATQEECDEIAKWHELLNSIDEIAKGQFNSER